MNTFENSRKHAGMPVQAMPVERHIAGDAAISGDAGVEASGWLDILKTVGSAVLPIAQGFLK
jgi:hypothetical protein